MALPTPKQIAALAKACRRSGIKSFKGEGIEFTLTDEPPARKTAKKASPQINHAASTDDFESDSLTDDQLLNWSVLDAVATTEEPKK